MPLITKKVAFSASHYYHQPKWSADQNQAFFGACANPFGHGHNYQVHVTVRGPIAPDTGMIINFTRLEPLLQQVVLSPLDHRNLNHEIPAFQNKNPTVENLAIYLWNNLQAAFAFDPNLALDHIKVFETDTLNAQYNGHRLSLTRRYDFSAAHQLAVNEAEAAAFGPCAALHGHNYRLWLSVSGQPDSDTGMIINIAILDAWVKKRLLNHVDHYNLNTDFYLLDGQRTTVENLAETFYRYLKTDPDCPVNLERLRLAQTDAHQADTYEAGC